MKVVSCNVNGLRAAARKGFFDWFMQQNADLLCLQEVKALPEQLEADIFCPPGYQRFFQPALKKGYSGVAIYSKIPPLQVSDTFDWSVSREEGRYLQADFPAFSVVSVYFPSGTSGDERQGIKYQFMEKFEQHLEALRQQARPCIVCGDWNIVHKEIDIKYFKANQQNSGCLPKERAWLNQVLTQGQYIDAFRVLNHSADEYTWWSQRSKTARANNAGWRIDYQIVSAELRSQIKQVEIYRANAFSDHAPVIVDYMFH